MGLFGEVEWGLVEKKGGERRGEGDKDLSKEVVLFLLLVELTCSTAKDKTGTTSVCTFRAKDRISIWPVRTKERREKKDRRASVVCWKGVIGFEGEPSFGLMVFEILGHRGRTMMRLLEAGWEENWVEETRSQWGQEMEGRGESGRGEEEESGSDATSLVRTRRRGAKEGL